MNARFVVTAIALANLLATSSAEANGSTFRAWKNYCTPGAFKACMSVTVQATQTATGTTVTLGVRNLQGSNWGIDNTGGYAIGGVWVTYHQPAAASCTAGEWCGPDSAPEWGDWERGIEGPATLYGTGLTDWGYDINTWDGPGGGPYEMIRGVGNFDKQAGIFGCTVPQFGPPEGGASYVGGVSTCEGWVTLTFTSGVKLTVDDIEVFLMDQDQDGLRQWCSFDPSSGSNCEVVVPEPITVVLLGTGLAGLGGAGLVRRRRKPGELA